MLSYDDTFLFIISMHVLYAEFVACQEKYVGSFLLCQKSYFSGVEPKTLRALSVL